MSSEENNENTQQQQSTSPPPFQQANQQQQPNPQQRKLDSLSEYLGFEIPVESVSLPSKGKVYSYDHPLCNKETVDVKSMTAKEEDILTSRALIKNGTVISELLRSCLIDKSVNVDSLLVGDRNALMIALRVSGYGPEYSVKIQCPECAELFTADFSLANLTIKELGRQPVSENTNLFKYKLPASGLSVKYRLMTGADDFELSKQAERMKKLGKQIDSNVSSRLIRSVVSINDESDRNKISRVVMNLVARDARALRKEIEAAEPEVNMAQFTTCKLCGEESEVDVPIGASFFWPDVDS